MRDCKTLSGMDLLRFGREYRKNYVEALYSLRRQHGDTIFLAWPTNVWLFFAPDDVQEILQKKNKCFAKDQDLKSHANRGVIFSEGSDWQNQRKGLSPIFRESILENFAQTTFSEVNIYLMTGHATPNMIVLEAWLMRIRFPWRHALMHFMKLTGCFCDCPPRHFLVTTFGQMKMNTSTRFGKTATTCRQIHFIAVFDEALLPGCRAQPDGFS